VVSAGAVLLYGIVGPADLMSAVRLNATARYLGVLVGPAAGGFILLALGPSYGIFLNTIFYLPLLLWLVNAPYGPRFRTGAPPPTRPVRGLADITHTARTIRGHSIIVSMTILAGAASFFVGSAYSPQMPGFADDLGHGDPELWPARLQWRVGRTPGQLDRRTLVARGLGARHAGDSGHAAHAAVAKRLAAFTFSHARAQKLVRLVGARPSSARSVLALPPKPCRA
jgi:hypothetical protein